MCWDGCALLHIYGFASGVQPTRDGRIGCDVGDGLGVVHSRWGRHILNRQVIFPNVMYAILIDKQIYFLGL